MKQEFKTKIIFEKNFYRTYFFSRATSILIFLQKGKNKIGHIRLLPINNDRKIWETHSNIDPIFHNRGLGVLLYNTAISYMLKKGFKVASSEKPSRDAIRVWNSKRLNSIFMIKEFNKNNFIVENFK